MNEENSKGVRELYKQDSYVAEFTREGKGGTFPWCQIYERKKDRKPGTIGLGRRLQKIGYGYYKTYVPVLIDPPKYWTTRDEFAHKIGLAMLDDSQNIRDYEEKRIRELINKGEIEPVYRPKKKDE